MPEEWVGVEDFARMCGYTVRYAQKMCREGNAPRHILIGRVRRFKVADINAWIASRTINPENK